MTAEVAKSVTGVVQSVTATGYTVIVGGNLLPVFQMGYLATPGEMVRLMSLNNAWFLVGPPTPYPTMGTVTSVGSNTVTLGGSWPQPWANGDGTLRCAFSSPSTPSVGQQVLVVWSGGPTAVGYGSPSAAAAPPPPPPAPPAPAAPAPSRHSTVFKATGSASYSQSYGDWFTSQVWASATCLGLWLYGSTIASTIPASADNGSSKVELYVNPAQIQGNAPNFAAHNYRAQPSGAPGFGTAWTVGVQAGWVTLETGNQHGLFAGLKAGGGAFGVGCVHGGYNIFQPFNQGQSGALRITSTY